MSDIPIGYCQCGCGQKTGLSKRTDKKKELIKGLPNKYVFGHWAVGKTFTEEHLANLSSAKKGCIGTWTGKKIPKSAREKMSLAKKGKPLTKEHIEKIRQSNLGQTRSEETKEKLRGRKHTLTTRTKQSYAQRGGNGSNWKGGVSSELNRLRHSLELREWRSAVFERDSNTCQHCGSKEEIEPHHIKSFAKYPELRIDINNGITLCKKCHKKVHKKKG